MASKQEPGPWLPIGGRSSGKSTSATKAPTGCEIQELFKLLGKPHMLDILHLFTADDRPTPRRFVDIQNALGISPNTLTGRLKVLVAAGFLTRTAYNEIPPRVDYAPTKKTRDLAAVFRGFGQWTGKHDLRPVEVKA